MHLVLYPKTRHLAVGVGIGVAMLVIGRLLVRADDNAALWPLIGTVLVLGGTWVAVSCAFRIFRPSPSFAADETGFSVMGKRKQPWERFQGVGVQGVKQHGITTTKWVTIKVGKGPAFARKRHIKWTHLSDSAEDMAAKIFAYAQRQHLNQINAMAAERAAQASPAPAPVAAAARAEDAVSAPQPKRPAATPPAGKFADGPIKSHGGGIRGLFGG